MFKGLKEKLKNWTKKVAKNAETEETPEEVEEIEAKIEETIKEKKPEKQVKKEVVKEPKEEVKIPEKYNVAEHKFEPDLEKIEEVKKEVEKKEKKPFFKKISLSKITISEKDFEVYADELEMLLLENNVAYEVAEKIIKELKEKVIGKELLKKELEGEITDAFKDIIREILISPPNLVKQIKEKLSDQSKDPYVILFCGINGSGKTTTTAKIAENLKSNGISCAIAAADTFRAASIEQIKKHGEKIGVKVIAHEYGADPASVGFDAIKYAKKNFINCVLIDTAGRMHTSKNLLKEIEKIVFLQIFLFLWSYLGPFLKYMKKSR